MGIREPGGGRFPLPGCRLPSPQWWEDRGGLLGGDPRAHVLRLSPGGRIVCVGVPRESRP